MIMQVPCKTEKKKVIHTNCFDLKENTVSETTTTDTKALNNVQVISGILILK